MRASVGDCVQLAYRLRGGDVTGTVEYRDGEYVGVRMNRSKAIFEAYDCELTVIRGRVAHSTNRGRHP